MEGKPVRNVSTGSTTYVVATLIRRWGCRFEPFAGLRAGTDGNAGASTSLLPRPIWFVVDFEMTLEVRCDRERTEAPRARVR